MLHVEGITKRFAAKPDPVEALIGVDLDVERGTFAAVLGASGCGKTTLLRIIAGFERPDSGEVRIDGKLVASADVHVAPEHRNVGIVAQDGALFPHLNVAANIAYGLDGGWSFFRSAARRAERAERVEELLELVGLPGMGSRRPDELSGGQQQRVALARALAPRPSMILLDEPFSALDAGLRVEVREQVRDVLKSLGTTAVLVTHDQSEALSMADEVAIMRSGKVVQYGAPSQVYTHPSDAEVAGFLGDAVLVSGTVLARVADTNGAGTIVAAANGANTVNSVPGVAEVDGLSINGRSGNGDLINGRSGNGDLINGHSGNGSVATLPVQHLAALRQVVTPLGTLDAEDLADGECAGQCTVVLRPEQLELADSGLSATVTSVSFYGHDGLVRLEVPDLPNGVTVRCNSRDLPRVGDHVNVRVAAGTTGHLAR